VPARDVADLFLFVSSKEPRDPSVLDDLGVLDPVLLVLGRAALIIAHRAMREKSREEAKVVKGQKVREPARQTPRKRHRDVGRVVDFACHAVPTEGGSEEKEREGDINMSKINVSEARKAGENGDRDRWRERERDREREERGIDRKKEAQQSNQQTKPINKQTNKRTNKKTNERTNTHTHTDTQKSSTKKRARTHAQTSPR
jgi:hypothetical protein